MPRVTQKKRLKHLLPTPKGRWPKKDPLTFPLFPEVGHEVSEADIALYIEVTAPRISEARRARYAIDYRVADKVRRDKAAGRWPPRP